MFYFYFSQIYLLRLFVSHRNWPAKLKQFAIIDIYKLFTRSQDSASSPSFSITHYILSNKRQYCFLKTVHSEVCCDCKDFWFCTQKRLCVLNTVNILLLQDGTFKSAYLRKCSLTCRLWQNSWNLDGGLVWLNRLTWS